MSEAHVLYRMRNPDGALLYVGITMNVVERFRAHRGDKDWWPQIARIDLEHFASRDELEAAEIAAVRAEAPMFNRVRFVGPDKPLERPARVEPDAPSLRVDAEVWRLVAVFARNASDRRTNLLTRFMRWYAGEPALSDLRLDQRAAQLRVAGLTRLPSGRTPKYQPMSFVRAEVWQAFGEAVALAGRTRSAVLVDYLEWYLRAPGAKQPQRPDLRD